MLRDLVRKDKTASKQAHLYLLRGNSFPHSTLNSGRTLSHICWEVLSYTNEGWTWLIILPLIFYFQTNFLPDTYSKLKSMYIFLLFDLILIGIIKFCVKRKRPMHNTEGGIYIGPDSYSFPSGHTSRGIFLVLFGIFILEIAGLFVAFAGLWGSLIVLSRLALGRHFISDVVAGILCGCLEFTLYIVAISLNWV